MASDLIGGDRPLTTCLACGQTDDHPKHSVMVDPAGGWADWHLDCHAQVTGCEDCSRRIAGRPDGATGAQLLEHLLAPTPTATEES